MKIAYVMPIKDMSGSTRGPTGRTYYSHKGVKVSRQYVKTEIKNTQYQIRCQEILRITSKAWKLLEAEKIESWNTFADGEEVMNYGQRTRLSGIDWWNRANFYNLINSEELQEDPPVKRTRAFINEVEYFKLYEEDANIRFRIRQTDIADEWFWVYFKLSPGYDSPGRKPRAFEYRSMVKVTWPDGLRAITGTGNTNIAALNDSFDFTVGQYIYIKYLVLSWDKRPQDTGIFRTIIQEGV